MLGCSLRENHIANFKAEIETERWLGRPTDRQTDRQTTVKQNDRQTERQTDREADRKKEADCGIAHWPCELLI